MPAPHATALSAAIENAKASVAIGSPTDAALAIVALSREIERIRSIVKKWTSMQHVLLLAGEMTAQERRSVRAVVEAMKREVENP